jgi:hypothetical protein
MSEPIDRYEMCIVRCSSPRRSRLHLRSFIYYTRGHFILDNYPHLVTRESPTVFNNNRTKNIRSLSSSNAVVDG